MKATAGVAFLSSCHMNLLTELKEGLAISWSAIRANKMRSVLTTLGIVIGIVTVTLMGTAIEGLNRAFLKAISSIGADVLYVQREDWSGPDTEEEWRKIQKRPRLTIEQAGALERDLTLARAVAPVAFDQRLIKYEKRNASGVHDRRLNRTAPADGRHFDRRWAIPFRGRRRGRAAGVRDRLDRGHQPVSAGIAAREDGS